MDAALAFGRVLRKMRQDAALTQEQLGLEADLRRTYISILGSSAELVGHFVEFDRHLHTFHYSQLLKFSESTYPPRRAFMG